MWAPVVIGPLGLSGSGAPDREVRAKGHPHARPPGARRGARIRRSRGKRAGQLRRAAGMASRAMATPAVVWHSVICLGMAKSCVFGPSRRVYVGYNMAVPCSSGVRVITVSLGCSQQISLDPRTSTLVGDVFVRSVLGREIHTIGRLIQKII